MSTIVWLPDNLGSANWMNPTGEQLVMPLHLPCWDGIPASAQIVQQFLNTGYSGTNQWPAPTIGTTDGILNFASFSGTTNGQSWTVPAFSFPLGAIIWATMQSTPGDTVSIFSRSVLELTGTIRNEY